MKLIFRLRPFRYFLKRNWYSVRGNIPFFGLTYYLLDFGAITLGFALKGEYAK